MSINNNQVSLHTYYHRLIEINKALRISVIEQGASADPLLLLSPEIAAKIDLNHPIAQLLKDKKSKFYSYYEPEGHFLLLAECGYWADLDLKKINPTNEYLRFKIELLHCLNCTPKDLISKIKPYAQHLAKQEFQDFLADQLMNILSTIEAKQTQSADIFRSSLHGNTKFIIEVCKFMDFLYEKIKILNINLNLVSLKFFSLQALVFVMEKRALKEVISVRLRINDLFIRNYISYQISHNWSTFENIKNSNETLLMQNLITTGNSEKLIGLVNNDLCNSTKQKFLDFTDRFLTTDWDLTSVTINDLNILSLILSVLGTLNSQKTRIKKINSLIKKFKRDLE
jgi:hypothetical protein